MLSTSEIIKRKYCLLANGSREYCWARSAYQAQLIIRKRVLPKVGKCNITDIMIETKTGWSRIIWKSLY